MSKDLTVDWAKNRQSQIEKKGLKIISAFERREMLEGYMELDSYVRGFAQLYEELYPLSCITQEQRKNMLNVIVHLADAVKKESWVLICDVIEYEATPTIQEVITSVGEGLNNLAVIRLEAIQFDINIMTRGLKEKETIN